MLTRFVDATVIAGATKRFDNLSGLFRLADFDRPRVIRKSLISRRRGIAEDARTIHIDGVIAVFAEELAAVRFLTGG
jgi:hypothetical protein